MRSQLLFHLQRVSLIPAKDALRGPFSLKNLPKSLLCTSLEHTAMILAILMIRAVYNGLICNYLGQFTRVVKLENWSPIFLVRFCRLNFVHFRVILFGKVFELTSQSDAQSVCGAPRCFGHGCAHFELIFYLLLLHKDIALCIRLKSSFK